MLIVFTQNYIFNDNRGPIKVDASRFDHFLSEQSDQKTDVKACVNILLNMLKALNDELLHERCSCNSSANINKISNQGLIGRIFLSIFVKDIKSKGFFDILTSYYIQSADCVILDHFDIFLIP